MRATGTAAIFLSCIAVGCSWITAFAVSNRSESPIQITYSYRGTSSECPIDGWEPPAVSSTQTLGWWRPRAEWADLGRDQYQMDAESCSVSLILQPRQAVRVARGSNYTGHESRRWGILADLRLTISTPSGEIAFQGLELVRSFSKRSDALYEFSYATPEFAQSARGAAHRSLRSIALGSMRGAPADRAALVPIGSGYNPALSPRPSRASS